MQYRAALVATTVGLAVTLALAACQQGAPKGDWRSSPLGRDMDRICNAVEQSGANAEPEGARQLLVAQWLGANIESQDGRDFLGGLAQQEGAAKAKALEDQARALGIARCPIADVWKSAP